MLVGWCLALGPSLFAGESEPAALSVDLDGDGKAERIDWAKFAETEEDGTFYQVRVLGNDGSLLWEGPKVTDTENPMVFGDWHFGFSLPELAADIDGDGAVELVTPAPQSDVSPTWYRLLKWKGGRFAPAESGGMLLETPRGSGNFPWSRDNDRWQGLWISSFKKANADGSLEVEAFEYEGEATPRSGAATVTPVAGGFRVKRWTRPLGVLPEMPPPGVSGEPGATGSGGGGLVVYRAKLGSGDHFNSQGERLDKVTDVLRQDRSNYHRGKGDDEDGPDGVFSTLAAREAMDAKRVVPVGVGEAAFREAVVNGTPLVEVEVTSDALKVKILKP